VLRNIGSNWVLILVTVAATYVLTPFILDTLGHEGYGTWTLITAITGYIGLLALGVPMASVRYLAQHVAEGDVKKMNATIGSCAGLYLAIGGTSILVGGVLMGLFAVYEIPGPLEKEAHLAFALMVLHVSAGFIGLLPEGILFSHHAFVPRNVIRISGVLLRLGLTYLFLRLSSSLVLLALVQILCLAFDFGMTWLIVRRQYPDTRISLGDFDFAVVRRIFSFSVYVLLLNAGARLVFETDALVIGAMLGVGAIPFYVVANSFAVYLMDFVIAIAAVVSPMATKLRTEQRSADLVEMFLKWSKVALSLTLMAGLFLIVFGSRFIGWWIDPSFEAPSGQVLQILMVSSFLFLPVRGVAVPVLMGLGKPKIPAIASLGAGLLNLVMSLILVVPFGLVGVAVGTAIPNMIFAVVVLAVTCRELGITVADYARYVVPRALAGALPPLVLLLWFRLGLQVQTLAGMAGAGTAMVLVFALIWVFYVYRHDPYVDLRPHFVRFRAWSRA
jgi:O-antigen/teichoic acid export membrane protein